MDKANKKSTTILLIMMVTVISKLTGFGRDMLLASKFGASMDTDAYLAAMTFPFLIFNIAGLAWGTVFIPILTEYHDNDLKKRYLISNTLNISLVLFCFLSAIGVCFSPLLVKMVVPHFNGFQYNLTVKLTNILFPLIVFMCISALISSILQTYRKFIITAGVGIIYNIIIITTLFCFSDRFGVLGLTIATVIAGLSQVLIQLPSLFKIDFKYQFILNIKDPNIHKLMRLSIPTMIGLGGWELNVLIDRNLASGLGEGSISALNYANTINWVALGVFGLTIASIIYPELSKLSVNNDLDAMRKLITQSINQITFILIPASIGMIVLRHPIIRILFERGAFDEKATNLTASALLYYTIGLWGFGVRDILNRCFYSLQDMKSPMWNSLFMIGINIIGNLVFMRFMGLSGIALATSISILSGTLMLLIRLNKKIGLIDVKNMVITLAKAGLGSIVMGVATHFFYNFISMQTGNFFYGKNIIVMAASIILAVFIYIIISYVLKIEQGISLIHMVYCRLRKVKKHGGN